MQLANSFSKQSGTAIFMALLVVTIVTALASTWFIQTRLNVRDTQELLLSEQIYLYAEGVVDWGVSALKIDDTVPKILPKTFIHEKQGMISGRIDKFPKQKNVMGVNTKQAMVSNLQDYFLLRTEVNLSNQRLILYSLLHRITIDGKLQITIIWQNHGLA